MPCSERPDPGRDTDIVETGLERGKEAPKSLIMVQSRSIRLAGPRERSGVPRFSWQVEPEEPITKPLGRILDPTDSRPNIRFSAWNLPHQWHVGFSCVRKAKRGGASHATRSFVNL
jgi:hypothetical protein